MNTTHPFPIGTDVTFDGAPATVVGVGTVHDDGRPVPTCTLMTPTGRITVRGGGLYRVEAV
jgi:uncharacterized protein (DUF39 family)